MFTQQVETSFSFAKSIQSIFRSSLEHSENSKSLEIDLKLFILGPHAFTHKKSIVPYVTVQYSTVLNSFVQK